MNQEDSEQNEADGMKKGADSTGKVMHMQCRIKVGIDAAALGPLLEIGPPS